MTENENKETTAKPFVEAAGEPVVHYLKTWPEYYDGIRKGWKNFEIRENDRDFRVGDILLLREFEPWDGGGYTGNVILAYVKYICSFAQKDGWVVMALDIKPNSKD